MGRKPSRCRTGQKIQRLRNYLAQIDKRRWGVWQILDDESPLMKSEHSCAEEGTSRDTTMLNIANILHHSPKRMLASAAADFLGRPDQKKTTDKPNLRPWMKPMRKLSGLAIFAVGFVVWHAFDLGRGEARADGSSALRYHYVSLDEALPPGFAFFDPVALTNNGRVYVTLWACGDTCVPSVGVYQNGTMSRHQRRRDLRG